MNALQGSAQFLTFMSQYIGHVTSAGRKAGSLSTNKSQFVDTLITNKAYLWIIDLEQELGKPHSNNYL